MYHDYERHSSQPSGPLFQNAAQGGMSAHALARVLPFTTGYIGGAQEQLTDSVDLHAVLGVVTQHRDWARRRLQEHSLVEGRDYIPIFDRADLSDQVCGHGGDRRSVRYALTLRAARIIAMAEGTPRAHLVRDYLERAMNSPIASPANLLLALRDPAFAVQALLAANQELLAERSDKQAIAGERDAYKHEAEEARPAVEHCARVLAADCEVNLSEVGRLYGTSSTKGVNRMLSERILYRDASGILKAYQQFRDRGYFRWIEETYDSPRTGEPRTAYRTVITPKGLQWLFQRWNAADEAARGAQ